MTCASGNDADVSLLTDFYSAIAQDDKHPMTNVGAIERNGKRWDFSQYGEQHDLYAVGVGVDVQTKHPNKGDKEDVTSFGKYSYQA